MEARMFWIVCLLGMGGRPGQAQTERLINRPQFHFGRRIPQTFGGRQFQFDIQQRNPSQVPYRPPPLRPINPLTPALPEIDPASPIVPMEFMPGGLSTIPEKLPPERPEFRERTTTIAAETTTPEPKPDFTPKPEQTRQPPRVGGGGRTMLITSAPVDMDKQSNMGDPPRLITAPQSAMSTTAANPTKENTQRPAKQEKPSKTTKEAATTTTQRPDKPSTTTEPPSTTIEPPAGRTVTNVLSPERTTAATVQSQTTTLAPSYHNGIKGTPYIMCMPEGIMFTATAWFPFSGRLLVQTKREFPECMHTFNEAIRNISVFIPYVPCGTAGEVDSNNHTMYSLDIVLHFHPSIINEHTTQSFSAQCMLQKLDYDITQLPKQVEQALERLEITPILVEKQARMPQCLMKIVPEQDGEEHHYGASGAEPVRRTDIGQKLKIEFSLDPPSDAFGFLIRNCSIVDEVSERSVQVIDAKGCSSDPHLFGHPHYDVYHDLAIVHWHAFKVPDRSLLSINCGCHVCSDIPDDDGVRSCDLVPTPPYCPKIEKIDSQLDELVSLFEGAPNMLSLSRETRESVAVKADVQVFDEKFDTIPPEAMRQIEESQSRRLQAPSSICLSWSVFLITLTLLGTILCVSFGLCLAMLASRRRGATTAPSHYVPSAPPSMCTTAVRPPSLPPSRPPSRSPMQKRLVSTQQTLYPPRRPRSRRRDE